MKRLFLIICFLSVVIGFPISGQVPVIQSGHSESIQSLKYSAGKKILLSSGQDGSIKIWNVQSGELFNDIRVSHLPVENIIIHPVKTQFAALVRTSFTSAKIYVYDWEKGVRLYSIELNEIPLFISYSAKGSYLIYGRAEWNSVVVYDANKGYKLPLLNKGFGIVSFIATNESEKKIVMYQSSGKIIYKEMKTGKDLQKKNTLPNIKAISISANRRYISGTVNDELVIVDLTNGKKVSSVKMPNILSTLFDVDKKEILCLVKKRGNHELVRFHLKGSNLLQINEKPTEYDITDFVYIGENIYISNTRGEIFYFSGEYSEHDFIEAVVTEEPTDEKPTDEKPTDEKPTDEENPEEDEPIPLPRTLDIKKYRDDLVLFSSGNLQAVTGIAFSRDQIAIGTSRYIVIFDSSLIDIDPSVQPDYRIFDNTLSTPVGLGFYKPNKLLVWSKTDTLEDFYILDINSGEPIEVFEDYNSPLTQLEILKNGILSLEESGMSKIIDKRTFESKFQYSAMGLNKLMYIPDEDILIAARSKVSQAGSSLFTINPSTGETVPITSVSILSYDLAHDVKRKRLYSLSINKENEQTFSMLKMHYGKGFEKEKILYKHGEEDLSASLVIDDEGKYLYTSMGFNSIRMYNGNNVSFFAKSEAIPRKLFISGERLFSLNRNGSLSIWNRFSREKIIDLYLIKSADLEWIAVMPTGRYFSSRKADKFVLVNPNGSAVR